MPKNPWRQMPSRGRMEPTARSLTMADLRIYLRDARTVGEIGPSLSLYFVAPKSMPDAERILALLASPADATEG